MTGERHGRQPDQEGGAPAGVTAHRQTLRPAYVDGDVLRRRLELEGLNGC
jgi:hypothetical protein